MMAGPEGGLLATRLGGEDGGGDGGAERCGVGEESRRAGSGGGDSRIGTCRACLLPAGHSTLV